MVSDPLLGESVLDVGGEYRFGHSVRILCLGSVLSGLFIPKLSGFHSG